MQKPPVFATVDPFHGMTADDPGVVRNLLGGAWAEVEQVRQDLPDPLHGGDFLRVPDTENLAPFVDRLRACADQLQDAP